MCSTQYVGQGTLTKYNCGVQSFVLIYSGAYPDVRVFVDTNDQNGHTEGLTSFGGSGELLSQSLEKIRIME